MSEPPKPVRARPVSQPAPQAPQPRQATINDLAYELRETRLYLQRVNEAKRKSGALLLIFGGILLAFGLLGFVVRQLEWEQKTAWNATVNLPPPNIYQGLTANQLMGISGGILVLVGAVMRYHPDYDGYR